VSTRGLVKAYLMEKEGAKRLECQFNPREYTIATSATWHKAPTKGAPKAPTPEFVGANPRTLQLELFFDAWESSHDVGSDLDTLFEWTNPTQKSLSSNQPNPPILVFHWGVKSFFDAYLKQVSAKVTMFRSDGTACRATASTTFEEVPNEAAGQNPSSGGAAGRRTHLLGDGDSLQSIAYAEYGNPALWRGLAEVNGIDDPLRVRAGTRLLIPLLAHAKELS
jgi:hypothetical protein